MKMHRLAAALAAALLCSVTAVAATPPSSARAAAPAAASSSAAPPNETLVQRLMKPLASTTHGTVTVEGKPISYEAVAGTLVIDGTGTNESTPEAAMSYVAYFKQGADPARRPITFLYNGGPGSSTVWLLMGAFAPVRVVTNDHTHTPAAPYQLIDNPYSLLDASDLVFIDMPGTGFGRLLPHGKTEAERAKSQHELAKKIWSVDGDAHMFARFITQFLGKYNRWNSPKYLYGESYGTTRSAVLADDLEQEDNIDLNGVILQSQILDFRLSIDGPREKPGDDMAYVLALPTYAATAWYHKRLPKYDDGKLGPLLKQVIAFTKDDYEPALFAGSTLGESGERKIADKLHDFTGLPVGYLMRADLRVSGGMFEHELQINDDTTTGRLDTRFSGPSMDPMARDAAYDPQSAAISSAYVSAFNTYVRDRLKFGQNMTFRPEIYGVKDFNWSTKHRPAGGHGTQGSLNVMTDLAQAMKYNPDLKVMLNGGFYDLATPFYTAIYEEHHLPIPRRLDSNISYAFYPSGHMVYVNVPSLHALHDNVAKFIEATDNQGAATSKGS